MPTYQYACSGCGHQFETVQSFSEDSLTTCPDCGQDRLRKVFGSVGVVFKGSGFYRNDSRNERKSGSAAGGQASGPAESSAPQGDKAKPTNGGKSEAKPAGAAAKPATPAKSSTPAKS